MLPMLKLYGIKSKLDAALEKRVWLKSGGYLVIEPTEALTVIDVNSGKTAPSQKKTDAQELYLRTNKEAAVEIAHQLRLRNISGMVLIDFINMKSEEDNEALIALLQQEIKKDPVKTVYCDMTQLGLIELTRKKTEAPLAEKLRDIVVAE
jgi:ribonuclease G